MTLESQILNLNARQILIKRLSTAQALSYTGPLGELVLDTTLKLLRIQDGVTPGGILVTIADYLANQVANVQSQLNFIKSNLDPAALDSLTEIVASFQNIDANLISNISTLGDTVANLVVTGNKLVSGNAEVILNTSGPEPYVLFPAASTGGQVQISEAEISSIAGNLALTSAQDAFVISNGDGTIPGGSRLWKFDRTGNLVLPQTAMNVSPAPISLPGITFTDSTFQTTAFTGNEFPSNIVNEHSGSAAISVGGQIAVKDYLKVRVSNNLGELAVEVNYNNPTNNVTCSAFRIFPSPVNLAAGNFQAISGNTNWGNFGNLAGEGDSLSFMFADQSFHLIYRVTVIARSMPGGGGVGDAYCVIEQLK